MTEELIELTQEEWDEFLKAIESLKKYCLQPIDGKYIIPVKDQETAIKAREYLNFLEELGEPGNEEEAKQFYKDLNAECEYPPSEVHKEITDRPWDFV